MRERNFRNIFFISLSQFGMVFCFNFIMVFIPFLIHDISPYPSQETLIWLGIIMGGPSFVAALVSTFWGSLATRFSPKRLFMRGLLSHAIIILLMGFVSSLPVMAMLRLIQGALGGISTVGIILVSASSSPQSVSKDMGLFQNFLTFGQLMGPPVGAFAAASLGYRGAFLSASALVFLTLAFCYFFVAEIPIEPAEHSAKKKSTIDRRVIIGWGLGFTTTVQLMFLPSVIPNVFQAFRVDQEIALKWAGLVVMLYTATAVIGTYVLCKVVERIRINRLIIGACLAGAVLQSLLSVSPGMVSFVALRMLQTALIAAVLPLVLSSFASRSEGKVMGFLNSARFGGNAMGPMIGTFVLAFSSLNSLYFTVSAMSLLALLAFVFFSGAVEEGGE